MKPNHETIYLVPTDYDGGQLTYSWCDCPAPGEGMDPADAMRYVREDIYLALQAQVEQLRSALRHLSHNAASSGAEMGLGLVVAADALDATPAQCLAEIKAQAVEEYSYKLQNSGRSVTIRSVKDSLINYANQLRQQAKAGSA